MENIKEENLNKIKTSKFLKLVALAPLAGMLLTSISFIIYLFIIMVMTDVFGRLGLGGFILEFLTISSLMVLLSFIISYGVSVVIMIPSYYIKRKYDLSDNKFWSLNCFVTSVLGLWIAISFISNGGPLLGFIIFLSFFCCGLFNASFLTSLLGYIKKKQLETKVI